MTNHKKTYNPFKKIPWGRHRLIKEIRLSFMKGGLFHGVFGRVSKVRELSPILRRFESIVVKTLKYLVAGYRIAFPRTKGLSV